MIMGLLRKEEELALNLWEQMPAHLSSSSGVLWKPTAVGLGGSCAASQAGFREDGLQPQSAWTQHRQRLYSSFLFKTAARWGPSH